jgi:serine/threonine-protein kinase
MRIDYSIEVLKADASTPFRSFTRTGDFYTPDCDYAPVPIVPGGAIEGESGYQCVSDGDCHLLVIHEPTRKLYEMWRANIDSSNTFYGGCLAIWDMTKTYGPSGRGENCTSADAAGFPISPLLFTADEVAAGWIDHAIRFILPNPRIRAGVYVHPATHVGGPSGPINAVPYGARLRLKASYDLNRLPNEGARVVARAMKRYGILLADGGNIALTAQSDRFTTHKWAALLGTYDLQNLQVTDFEMVDGGPRLTYTGDCERVP